VPTPKGGHLKVFLSVVMQIPYAECLYAKRSYAEDRRIHFEAFSMFFK
jgi:hypothetical protein